MGCAIFCMKMDSETLMLISILYIIFQILLWMISIYTTIFISIPYVSDNNPIMEFPCLMLMIFLTICLTRNFYMAYSVKSRISAQESENNKKIYLKENETKETVASTGIKEENKLLEKENNIQIKTVTYCMKCKLYRGSRAHHCSVCRVCSEKMDHHCHVIKNCVGQRNYKYFVAYLCSVSCTSLAILIFSALSCRKYFKDPELRTIAIIYNFPIRTIVVMFAALLAFLFVGNFFFYHIRLILNDDTDLERKYKIKHSNAYKEKIKKMYFHQKLKYLNERLDSVFGKGTSYIDLFWPETDSL